MRRRLLIVDDDATIRDSLTEALADASTEVVAAESAERALSLVGADDIDVVLTDVRMAGLDGVELLRLLRERAPDIDVVLMTAYDDMSTVVAAMRAGAAEFLVKPLDLHELRRVLARVFEDRITRSRADRRPVDALRHLPEGHPEALIGHDPRIIGVYKLIGQAATSRATVLIRGESGTGKELIARAIHAHSSDASAPFIAVNCAALPATLLESELFGHVRGAFTGATGDRKGRFALAGSVARSSSTRSAIRALNSRRSCCACCRSASSSGGAERAERTEARVIAATHRDLEQMRHNGEFRADLYYRLRVLEIVVPPLRERADDIPLLARHLVHRASAAVGRQPPVLSRDAVDVLMQHQWPGNVRELENCLTRAVMGATSDVIRADHVQVGNGRADPAADETPLESLDRSSVLTSSGCSRPRRARRLAPRRSSAYRVRGSTACSASTASSRPPSIRGPR